jgi:hypothetical protein
MGDVFISYAREDIAAASNLAVALESRGYSVWWDQRIPTGGRFDHAIEAALQKAKCVIVLWSAAAVSSQWVRSEAAEGLDRAILLPALLEPVKVPLQFRQLQAADLTNWRGNRQEPRVLRLLQDVDNLLRAAGKPTEAVSQAVDGPRLEGSQTKTPTAGQKRSKRFVSTISAIPVTATLFLIVLILSGVSSWGLRERESGNQVAGPRVEDPASTAAPKASINLPREETLVIEVGEGIIQVEVGTFICSQADKLCTIQVLHGTKLSLRALRASGYNRRWEGD